MKKGYRTSCSWQLMAFSLISCSLAYANPSGPTVKSGSASFENVDAATLSITTSDKAIINWNEFSIDAGELTQFFQPSSKSVVVNRVTSDLSSVLLGSLKANGKIFLINTNGILIGSDASIDTNGFIASTLSANPHDLLAENQDVLFQGSSTATITNLGQITAWDGDVYLIGYQVDNKGSIDASNGTVAIGAGQEVLLKPTALEKIVIRPSLAKYDTSSSIDNSGSIAACRAELKADGNALAMAINHTGSIDAIGIQEQNGEVYLVAGYGNNGVSGTITASNADGTGGSVQILGDHIALLDNAFVDASGEMGGGTVLIGGDKSGANPAIWNAKTTYFDKNVNVLADALIDGNGGKVITWADETTCFYGTISTRGGENSGDGGFVEVSGKQSLEFKGLADRLAPNGKAGLLLLDPYNITITSSSTTASFASNAYFPTANNQNVNITDLATALGSGPVTINTAAGVGGTGNITFSPSSSSADRLSYSSIYTLTLDNTANASAGSVIQINPTDLINNYTNQTIYNSLAGDIIINAANDVVINGGIRTLGNVTITTAANPTGNFNMTSMSPNADIWCTDFTGTIIGDVNFLGGGITNYETGIKATGSVTLNAMGDITLTGGTLDGTTGTGIDTVGAFPVTVSAPNLTLQTNPGANSGGDATINSDFGTTTVTVPGTLIIDTTGSLALHNWSAGIYSGPEIIVNAGTIHIISGACDSAIQTTGSTNFEIVDITATSSMTIDALLSYSGNFNVAGGTVNITTPTLTMNGPLSSNPTGGPYIFGLNGGVIINVDNLNMNGPSVANANLIYNDNGFLTINASQNVTMTGASIVAHGTSAVPILVKAGVDMSIDAVSEVINNSLGGSVTIVVDNKPPYNTAPNIGPGALTNLGVIATNGGLLQLYTAKQGQNNLTSGTLNGGAFVPGTLFVNTATEHWLTYYPNGVTGTPYTVFYKDGTATTPPSFPSPKVQPAITLFNQAAYEFLQDIEDYDFFWYWATLFTESYSPQLINKLSANLGFKANRLYKESIYHVLRKSYKEQNGKVSYLLR